MEQPVQQQQQCVSPQGGAPNQGQIFYNAPEVPAVGTGRRVVLGYHQRQSMGLGVTQIIIGFICMAFNSIIIGINVTDFPYIAHGIWCGIMFVVCGSFGIAAATTRSYCLIIAFMVLSIISAVDSVTLIGLGIAGAVVAGDFPEYPWYYDDNDEEALEIAGESIMAILAFFNVILAIWSAVICGNAACFTPNGVTRSVPRPQVSTYPVQYNGAPQVIYVVQQPQQGQFTQLPGVPMYSGYPYPNYGQQFQGVNVGPPAQMSSTNIPQPQGGYVLPAPQTSNGGQVNLIVCAADSDKF